MRIVKGVFILLLILLLTACKVPEEEKPFDPSLVEVSLHSEGNLAQHDEFVTEVKFSVSHNQEKYEPSKIVWTRNLIEVHTGSTFSYTPIAGLLSKTDIFATIYFMIDEIEHKFVTETLTIKVSGITASVEISAVNYDKQTTVIEYTLSSSNEPLEFQAQITGGYGLEELSWWLVNEDSKLETQVSEFDHQATFNYLPVEKGVLRVEARIKNSKFISNKIYIDSSYGKLLLTKDESDPNKVKISSSFNNNLSGTYSWEVLNQTSDTYEVIPAETELELVVETSAIDQPKMIRAIFKPENSLEVIISEPILLVGETRVVGNETEFLQALNDKVKTIELSNNILYSKVDDENVKNPIKINYPVTIIGNNYELSSLGIFTFIEVTSNNVWFKDLKINHSSRYNVLVSRSDNVYFENVEFIKPGGGSDMLTPGAGIYASGSNVIVKNIIISQAYNSGLRVEAIYQGDTVIKTANITLLGKYQYNYQELVAPIVSVSSKSSDANITAVGFDEFIIPMGGGKMIRRWSNDAYGVKWQLQEPYEVEYLPGAEINFSGIVINVRIGANESTPFGLDFVYLFLDVFKETGTIRVTKPELIDKVISEYTIYDYDRSIGGDFLLYQDKLGNPIKPTLPHEPGDYQVHIWVGDTEKGEGLYLGYIMVRVIPNA